MTIPSYLMPVFAVTAGQNAENLGIDESEIILLAYMLYDVSQKKVVATEHSYVRPVRNLPGKLSAECNGHSTISPVPSTAMATTEDVACDGTSSSSSMNDDDQPKQRPLLTVECNQETAISEKTVAEASTLETAIRKMINFVETHLPGVDCSDESALQFSLVADGPLHLRMVLHSECCQKEIVLPKWTFKYIDIREEISREYKLPAQTNSLDENTKLLEIEEEFSSEYGVRQIEQIGAIMKKFLEDGHKFNEPERIAQQLESGICFPDELVSDDCVIRVRGLPWQCSDHEIARFFRGLNINRGGVALCLSAQGRRNGEALIRFVTRQHRELAMRKHKHHLGQRYIEVYRDTGRNFIAVAAGLFLI